jgi:hypothetical protein
LISRGGWPGALFALYFERRREVDEDGMSGVLVMIVLHCLVRAPATGPSSVSPPEPATFISHRAQSEAALTADPEAEVWKGIAGAVAEKDLRLED